MKIKSFLFCFLVCLVTISTFLIYYFFQPKINYTDCPLCDANQYLKLYYYFKGNSSFDLKFPYYQRVLVPCLAALLPISNPLDSFAVLNLFFSIGAVVSLYFIWQKLGIKIYLICFGFFWFLFHWSGLIRQYIQDPAVVDVPTFFFQALFILIFYFRRFKILWVLGPIATLQKESFIALIFALLIFVVFSNRFYKTNFQWKDVLLALILSILCEIVLVFMLPEVSDKRTFLYTLTVTPYLLSQEPFRFVRWAVALYMAYGFFLVLAITYKNQEFKHDVNIAFLLTFSVLYLLFGLFAGGDMTRILTLGFPFIGSYVLATINKESIYVTIPSFLISIPVMYLLNIIPDFGITVPMEESWWVEYSSLDRLNAWGLYFLFHLLLINILKSFVPDPK